MIRTVGSSIIETIKSDFLTKKKEDAKKSESLLLVTIQRGSRLYLYNFIIIYTFFKCITIITPFDSLPKQFVKQPSFFDIVIVAPVLEETVFTYFLPRLLPCGIIATPIIFGLAHYHAHPKRWILTGCKAGIENFLHVTFIRANPTYLGACIMAHMLSNTIAYASLYFFNKA